MTVSAAVRLIPKPPALVQRRNTNLSESGWGERGRERGKGRERGGEGERGREGGGGREREGGTEGGRDSSYMYSSTIFNVHTLLHNKQIRNMMFKPQKRFT